MTLNSRWRALHKASDDAWAVFVSHCRSCGTGCHGDDSGVFASRKCQTGQRLHQEAMKRKREYEEAVS